MSVKPRFAILGAGNGGLAMAGDLAMRGFEVSGLFDRFPEAITPIQERGGVEVLGELLSGFAPIANATTDIGKAVRGADVVAVVTPAFAHEWMASQVAPHLEEGQILLITPGYPGGTLLFRKTLRENGLKARVDLAETTLILYAARIAAPAQVGIWGIKKVLWMAALPATRTGPVLEVLKPAIPQLEPLANVLEVGLNCINPMEHVPAVLLNQGRVDEDDGTRHFDIGDWVTPSIARVIEALDHERKTVLEALGVRFIGAEETLKVAYQGMTMKVVPMTGPVLEGSKTIPPRYITEDVPMGLVAWVSLGRKLAVATPLMESMINLADVIKGADYRAQGRTVERLGLADLSAAEILALVNG